MKTDTSVYAHVRLSTRARRCAFASLAVGAALVGLAGSATASAPQPSAVGGGGRSDLLSGGTYHAVSSRLSGFTPVAPVVPAPPVTPGPASTAPAFVTASVRDFDITHKPEVKGSRQVGGLLKVKSDVVAPQATSMRFQWLRNGREIRHATHASYRITRGDRGHSITVKVTFLRPGYQDLVVKTHHVLAG